ncbi:hypothetical protein DFJ77DRAFT_437446 [Powellomyces hirtus]|nr:hypothetical protein DFJ77DRAFT_437446 [Powellomyces hirtus]
MSEYWVANKKFFCIYCRIYLQDNKISRQTHESGKKHKDNVAGYLRDVHKRAEEKGKVDAETSAMMAKIEQAANKQYALDTRIKRPAGDDADADFTSSRPPAAYKATAGESEAGRVLDRLAKERADKAAAKALAAKAETVGGGDEESHPYGDWATVDTPAPPPPPPSKQDPNAPANATVWADEGDEEPEDNVKSFKVKEKTLPLRDDDDDGAKSVAAPVFKKRKVAGAARKRAD